MWSVLAAAALAFISKWVLDGGVRRRDRATMKEELELSGLIADTHLAGELQARAYARLEKYLAPTRWERIRSRRRLILQGIGALVAVVAAAALVQVLTPSDTSSNREWIFGIAAGVLIGAVWNAVDLIRSNREVRERADEQVDQVTATLEQLRATHDAYSQFQAEQAARAASGYPGPPSVEDEDEPPMPDPDRPIR